MKKYKNYLLVLLFSVLLGMLYGMFPSSYPYAPFVSYVLFFWGTVLILKKLSTTSNPWYMLVIILIGGSGYWIYRNIRWDAMDLLPLWICCLLWIIAGFAFHMQKRKSARIIIAICTLAVSIVALLCWYSHVVSL